MEKIKFNNCKKIYNSNKHRTFILLDLRVTVDRENTILCKLLYRVDKIGTLSYKKKINNYSKFIKRL